MMEKDNTKPLDPQIDEKKVEKKPEDEKGEKFVMKESEPSKEDTKKELLGEDDKKAQPKKEEKTKEPFNFFITQQTMPSVQPLINVYCVIGILGIVFASFLLIGLLLLIFNFYTYELSFKYSKNVNGEGKSCQMTKDIYGQPSCIINATFTLEKDLEPPIYIYYQLNGFYQNHRRYVGSRHDKMLSGIAQTVSSARSNCYPIYVNRDPYNLSTVTLGSVRVEEVYNPCGLIAWSMYNDTFIISKDGSVICDTSVKGTANSCTNQGIAWASDVNVKFNSMPEGTNYTSWPNDYYNEVGHQIPKVTDPDLIVWMRTAALPNFRKLYRIITERMEAGEYNLIINNNYPVTDFGGEKLFVLATTSIFGTKNWFLTIGYLTVAGAAGVLAIVFFFAFVIERITSKKKKEV